MCTPKLLGDIVVEHSRLHGDLGVVSPEEFEANKYAALTTRAIPHTSSNEPRTLQEDARSSAWAVRAASRSAGRVRMGGKWPR